MMSGRMIDDAASVALFYVRQRGLDAVNAADKLKNHVKNSIAPP
jgi:hypothetical protein